MRRAALLAACGLTLACASAKPPPTPPPRDVGLPLALVLPDLEGAPVDLGAARGHVTVVDFWASWCEPCKLALPELEELSRDLEGRGLRAYAVSTDENRQSMERFLAETPVKLPILWDRGGEALARFDVRFMPVTLIVDREGVIRHVHQGWKKSRPAEQRAEVEKLLAE